MRDEQTRRRENGEVVQLGIGMQPMLRLRQVLRREELSTEKLKLPRRVKHEFILVLFHMGKVIRRLCNDRSRPIGNGY